MSEDGVEERLRRAFAALKGAESRTAPSLERVLRRPAARRPSRARALRAWAAAAALLAVAAWLFARPSGVTRSERALDRWRRLEVASWGAPTRSLLDTPDRALLGGVPQFDTGDRWMPALRELPGKLFVPGAKTRRNDS